MNVKRTQVLRVYYIKEKKKRKSLLYKRRPASGCRRNERIRKSSFYDQQCKLLFRQGLSMDAEVIWL